MFDNWKNICYVTPAECVYTTCEGIWSVQKFDFSSVSC